MTMAQCKYPVLIKNPNPAKVGDYAYTKVPCGKCMICKQNHSRQWIFRLKQELKISASAFFCTFTYMDDALMYSESGIPTLNKKDFQNFIKKLRKENPKEKIRYFACGEYGVKSKRPHYHAIIFNSYKEHIEKTWNMGITHIGTVTDDSIAYNTKYIMKPNEEWQDQFKDDKSFQKEFVLMSKGIGKNYLENKEIVRRHKSRLTENFVTDEKGFRYPIPRYYKDKIFNDDERRILEKHSKRFSDMASINRHEEIIREETEGGRPYKDEVELKENQDHVFNQRLIQKQQKL